MFSLMAEKFPSGGSPSGANDRPRAQVSYEGEDEFSDLSLNPERKQNIKSKQLLAPAGPGERPQIKVDELKSVNDQGIIGLFRKIFAK